MTPPIVVLTPVRNEEANIERFLSVTTRFADHIILADQNSSDATRDRAKQFPKTAIIQNLCAQYDESERLKLLFEEARGTFVGAKVILVLDADEILASDYTNSSDWEKFIGASPGTTLWLEKPDLIGNGERCIRYKETYPYGFCDDGLPFDANWIHSYRVPLREGAPRFISQEIKLLHYAFRSPKIQRIKMAFYSMLEKERGATGFIETLRRRRNYPADKDYTTAGCVEPVKEAWFSGWEAIGIDMKTVRDEEFCWHAVEVLKMMKKRGESFFWSEDIWDIPWDTIRKRALDAGVDCVGTGRITGPDFVNQGMWRVGDLVRRILR
jgi:glycosyltransferase involved in cell wall biosynthesis